MRNFKWYFICSAVSRVQSLYITALLDRQAVTLRQQDAVVRMSRLRVAETVTGEEPINKCHSKINLSGMDVKQDEGRPHQSPAIDTTDKRHQQRSASAAGLSRAAISSLAWPGPGP
jgi:hypothetical protein